MNIGGVEIGSGQPCRFVAELSNNHNGDVRRALRLIGAAKDAGADLVKFQCYTPDELVALRGDGPAPEPWGAQGWTMRALYEKAATPHGWFPALVAECERLQIPWFSSVFGPESLKLLEALDCPAYKIARLDNKSDLARSLQHGVKPTVVSCADDDDALGAVDGDVVLWCPPGYPQAGFAGIHGAFRNVDEWDGSWHHWAGPSFDGLSYHGTDPRIPFAAAMMGAMLLEVHFQLDDELSELEPNVSLTAAEFRRMVDDVRAVEAMLG